jgi:hypothetical protein
MFKEYLNLISYNGQNYEIYPFLMVLINTGIYIPFQVLTRIRFRNLELWIRIRHKFRIHADPDPDPQH